MTCGDQLEGSYEIDTPVDSSQHQQPVSHCRPTYAVSVHTAGSPGFNRSCPHLVLQTPCHSAQIAYMILCNTSCQHSRPAAIECVSSSQVAGIEHKPMQPDRCTGKLAEAAEPCFNRCQCLSTGSTGGKWCSNSQYPAAVRAALAVPAVRWFRVEGLV